jgi:hypothetical protein
METHTIPIPTFTLYLNLPLLAVEGCGKADVVFVFDSSASIGERNWWVTKQFAIDIIKGLIIDADESRIGAVIYSEEAETRFVLGGEGRGRGGVRGEEGEAEAVG